MLHSGGMKTFYHETPVMCLPSILMNGFMPSTLAAFMFATPRFDLLGMLLESFDFCQELHTSEDPAKHKFSTPGIYITDSWDVAMHCAMPTRRDVTVLGAFQNFLEFRLGALGASSWAPYVRQCIVEVQPVPIWEYCALLQVD